MMQRRFDPPRRKLLLRQLEERLLFTAVPFLVPDLAIDSMVGGVDIDSIDVDVPPLDADSYSGLDADADEARDADEFVPLDLDRREAVIVDSRVDDYETLLSDLAERTPDLMVLVLQNNRDAFDQIETFLQGQSELDAIHLISHGDDATLRLGNLSLTPENLDAHAGRIAAWGSSLANDADLLLYGCDVASTAQGRWLADSLAALTGADVAASDDLTGHQSLGGDWDLEYATGAIETAVAPTLAAQNAFLHVLADADPTVTVAISGGTQPGGNATINLTFDNTGLAGDTGFGPFIDVLIPKRGADGIYDGTTTGDGSLYDLSDLSPADGQPDGEPDGLILPAGLSVTYQGLPLNSVLMTFGDDDGVGAGTTGTISHPYAVDAAGNPLDVVGQAGDQLLVIELPFGSFATDQPVVNITIDAPISPLADIGTPLTVFARGGFRYGNDALNNPATDPSLLSDAGTDPSTWTASDDVTPSSLIVTKSTTASGEGVTGPNWLQTYTITVDIPTGQTLSNFVLTDALPDNVQFGQITGVAVGGASNSGVSFTTNVNDTDGITNYYGQNEIAGGAGVTYDAGLVGTYGTIDPTAPSISNTLAIVADSDITGYDGTDISVTVTYFVPDKDAADDWVVGGNATDADKGEDDPNGPEVTNTAIVTGSMAALDLRDTGGPVSENDSASLDVKSISLQKSVAVVGGGSPAPGQLLEWTLSFQLSDYYTYGNLVIDDLFSDGQAYFSDAVNKAHFSVTDRGVTRAGDFAFVNGSAADVFDGTNTFVVDTSRHDLSDGGPGDITVGEVDNPSSDGQTEIKIFLSEALIGLGDDGILEGDLADNGVYDGQAAIGTITFYTEIQEDFVDPSSSEDRSVDQGDTLSNSATLFADNHVNRTDNALMPASGHVESDNAGTSITIPVGALNKQLHAINGDTDISGDLQIAPGDRVTYRLTYNLTTTDFEDLILTDFFPLPVFDVVDPDADGYSPLDPNQAWTFDADTSSTHMAAGVIELLASDTFYDIWDISDGGGLDDSIAPTISVDPLSNSLSINFGTHDGATNSSSQIDLLVTVTVGDAEFADGLLLTNMALASEASTGGTPSSKVDLVQIELSAPDLEITKGIVSTSVDATAIYSTTAVANELQEISGTASGPFTLTFEGETTAAISATATAAEVRAALEALSNVDEGDVIVSGGPVGGGGVRIAFIGQYQASDISLSVSGAGLTATELFAGGSAISESSRASVWGLPGAGANTSAIDAATIAALPMDADVSGLDGRDQVKYAVTIRNVGGADAYDIEVADLLPAGLEAAAGGLNLRVYDVAGNELSWTALGADPLVDGIRIHDPIAVYAWADDSFDRLVKMDSRDNFDSASNATFVGAGGGVTSIEAMALDPTTGILYAIDESRLGTIDVTTGVFTAKASRIDADISTTISDVDSLSFNPVTGELWGVDATGNELIQIDTTTGKAIVGAFGGSDFLVVPGGALDDIAIDFSGTIFASAANQLETLTVDEVAGTITRNLVGSYDFGGTVLDDMEGISVDQDGKLWGTTGNNDSSVYDDRIWEVDKATGDVSNPRALTVGGDFESVVAFDPNAMGAAAAAGFDNDTLIITYDVQVADSATADATYENNATLVHYSSVDDGSNFVTTTISDSAQINTTDLSLDTFITDSSESHTGVDGSGRTEGTIGEIIRYRVELALPEGSYTDVTLRELLPSGMTFLNDGTAQVAFLSDNDAIISTDIVDAAAFVVGNETSISGITPGGDFGNEDIANSLNGSTDSYGSGTDVYFRLGDLVNADNDANVEYVVLEFNAVVDNSPNSDGGDVLSHSSRLYLDDSTHVTTSTGNNDRVVTVEPQLSVASRTFSITQVDGGDAFTVTVTLSAASGANYSDAFELDFVETLPTGFTRSGAVTVTGGSFTPVITDNSTSTTVDLTIDTLPEGDTITITYDVIADDDLAPSGSHSFANDLVWTSIPGDFGTTGGSDPTGSNPPGASGDIDGERTGDDTTNAQNDYNLTDADNLAGMTLGFSKTLVGTEIANEIDADAIDDQAVIGELVTYRLQIDVPEGEATGLVVVDTLDAGFAFVGITSVTVGDDLAHVGGGAITTGSIATTVTSSGRVVTFDIGDVLDPTPLTTNDLDEIYIEYQVVVLDVIGNQGGPAESNTELNNSATLSYDGGSDITRAAANVEVIEPELTSTLNVFGAGGIGDTVIEAGETMTVSLELKNESGVDAFDVDSFLSLVRLDDGSTAMQNSGSPGAAPSLTVVDSAGVYTAADFQWVDPDNTLASGSDTQGWLLQVIDPSGFDIDGSDPTRTITFTVTGTAVSGIDAGVTYTTTAAATFTSIDGAAVDRSTYNTDSDERGYDPLGTRPQDDYRALSTAGITIAEPSIVKTLTDTEVDGSGNDDTQAVIGELLTYTIVVDLPQGETNDLRITDHLDVGIALVGMLSGPSPTTVSADGQTVTWDFGDVTNDPATSADDTITLVYQAVVLDVNANSGGTEIGELAANAATLDYNRPDGSPATQHSNDTTDQIVTLVEPSITVVRDAFVGATTGTTVGDAGDAVTYVITLTNNSGVDAFDITLSDLLPTLSSKSAVDSPTFSVAGTAVATAADFQWAAGSSNTTSWELLSVPTADVDLLAGQSLTITIAGTLNEDVPTGLNVTDTVAIDWTSIDDDRTSDDPAVQRSVYNVGSVERTGSDGTGGLLDDYANDSSATVTVNNSSLTKQIVATSLSETGLTRPGGAASGDDPTLEDVAVGEYITYRLIYTAAEGISDDLVIYDLAVDDSTQRLEILSAAVTSIGANLSFTDNGGSPLDFNGATDVNHAGLVIADSLYTDGINDGLTATLGDLKNAADGVVDADDQLVIEVIGRVIDIPANQADTLASPQHVENMAWFGIRDPNTGLTSNSTLQSVTAEIVAPELTFSKSIDKSLVDAGETVTVTLSATNNGGATAYQVQINDILDGADFDRSSVNVGIAGSDYPSDFSVTYTAATGTLVYDMGQLDAGETATFAFTVDVADSAAAGSTIENLGSITFASTLPSGHADEADARTYGDLNTIDDTLLDDTDSFTVRENTISGFVYVDADSSGTLNGGEIGIAGVTLTLSGTDHLGNAIVPIVITSADGTGVDPLGYYEFSGIASGNYTLTQTQASGYLDGDESVGLAGTLGGSSPIHDVIHFVLPTGSETTSTGNNFGEVDPGEIRGFVHRDADLDGDYDGSGGLQNVTVTITYTDDRIAGATQTVSTDVDGRFVFADLRPGSYTVSVDSADSDLNGYLDGIERDAHNGVDSTTDYVISGITLAQGEIEDDKWFGVQLSSSIAGYVYYDDDNDGTKDAGESGLIGAQIELTGSTFEGDLVSTVIDITDAAGYYEFTSLLPGTYDVRQIVAPSGYIDGRDTAGDPAANTTTNDLIANIVLSDGENSTGNLFGELRAATLSGVVFNDFNGNGTQDSGEPGIEAVAITLTGTEQLPDGSTAAITPIIVSTAADGSYTIDNLRPGTYTITETHPTAYSDGTDNAGTLGGSTSVNDTISGIVVTSDDDGTNYNFAETGASIAGTVFRDDDRDGVFDGGEPGIGGVTIELYESDGTTLITTMVTEPNGDYSFDHLAAGVYVVQEVQPGEYTSSPSADTNRRTVTLVTGSDNDANHFGEALWDLSGRVWFDRDAGGDNDAGEVGFDAVTVTLVYAGADGNLLTTGDNTTVTTTTDGDGNYSFTELFNGNYRVTITTADLPDGVTNNVDPDGGIASQSDLNIAGADIANHDFGYLGSGVISDRIWLDVNGDGFQDAGEPGLAGVRVDVLFAGDDGDFSTAADNWNLSTVSDANGLYSFDHLPDGNYRIAPNSLDLPGSTAPTFDVDGGGDGVSELTLSGSPTRNDADFGFRGTRAMAGQVWLDRNANDVSGETNEPGLGGVTVELTFAGKDGDFATTGDNFVVTTVTDGNGNYSFDNLADGDYRVTSTTGLPSGLAPTSGGGGPPDGIRDFSISGADPANQNLGHVGSSTIGNWVWLDHDGDGAQNVGSIGLGDVQVTLVYTGADGIVDGDDQEFTLTIDSDNLAGTLGQYAFDHLPAGTFVVSIDATDTDLPAGLTPFASTDSFDTTAVISLATSETNNTTDFGLRGTRSAGGLVFFDADANGAQSASNEAGFAAVTMTLVGAGQDGVFSTGDDITLSLDTDTDGLYEFTNLADGNYRISVDTGDIPGVESQTHDIDLTLDDRGDFSLSGSRSDIDFGYRGTATISDRVWFDLDADAVQDAGEVGIANQTVQAVFAGLDGLFGSADDMAFSTTTDANGLYAFNTMLDGDYRISVLAAPSGMTNTAAPDDGAGVVAATSEITLGASSLRTDVDLGFTGLGDVAGTVWFDYNGDGNNDANEPGVPGVNVQLQIDIDGDGTIDQTLTQTVANDGTYAWTNLPAGSFTVTVLTPPSGATPTFDTDGTTTPHVADFVIPAGGSAPDQSFGYVGTGSISGIVIYDVNDNGSNDLGPNPTDDRGIAGGDVRLDIDLDGDGNIDLTRTIQSDADGSYSFQNLLAGDYTVTVDPTTLPDSLGDNPTWDADGNVVSPHQIDVTVAAGTDVTDRNFGYHGSPDLAVTITDNLINIGSGQAITYTIDIENLGTSRATGSVLTIDLPTNVLENIASTDPTAVIDAAAGTITSFNLGEIGEAATLTKTVTAKVVDALDAGIDNVSVDASILDDGTHGIDDDLSNNDSTDTDIVIAAPDLRTELTAPLIVQPGDPIVYDVVIHNDGDQGATGVQGKSQIDVSIIDPSTVVFRDSLGAMIPLADISFNQTTGEITWDAGSLQSGDNVAMVIQGQIYDPVLTLKANFEIDVIACDDGLNGDDPTDADDGPLDNNHREAFTTLNATPDYFVDIEIDAPADHTFQPSETVTFTITAGNLGNQNGDNVEVVTQLPTSILDLSSIVIDNVAATYDATTGEITWAMGSVTGRGLDVRTITVTATIPLVTADPLANRVEFSSIVFDDGLNGVDFVQINNFDRDGRGLLQYAYDSFDSFLQKTGFDAGVPWYGGWHENLRTILPLPVDPIYSGLAEPGTTLLLRIFDDEGREIGSRAVVADTGGNWIASFPGVVIWENPHAMTVETIGALHTLGNEDPHNVRRYFQPALHPSMFFAPRPTVQSVMQETPTRVISSIHEANLNPLQFGTANHSYDFNVASNSTAGR